MVYVPINFSEKSGRFSDKSAPKVVAELNDYQIKLVKIKGEFVLQARPVGEMTAVNDGSV